MLIEYAKVSVLVCLLLVVLYSAGLKVWLARLSEQSLSIREVDRDYDTLCKNSGGDKNDACRAAVDAAADTAQQKCNGYLSQESHCTKNAKKRRRDLCEAQKSAADGCISLVIAAKMKEAGF